MPVHRPLNRQLLKRLLGSFLVAWLFGSLVDVTFQILILGIDPDRVVFPVVGILLAWLLVFGLWDRLRKVELRGIAKTLAMAILGGIVVGAILGAGVYAPIRTSRDPKATGPLYDEIRAIHQGDGVLLGAAGGALLGATVGVLVHLWRKSSCLPNSQPSGSA
jgi:integral membrane sensor domain MASE1